MGREGEQAFTLVEILVAAAISTVIVIIMCGIANQLSSTVLSVTGKMDAFQNSQAAFDIMTQKLADATLNTYYDYETNANGAPYAYIRRSNLHFLIAPNSDLTAAPVNSPANANSGHSIYFQAPEGYSNTSPVYANTPGLLNSCGYFVEFGANSSYWPIVFGSSAGKVRYRYRLMQAIQSTEYNGVYTDVEGTGPEAAPWNYNTNPWFAALNSLAMPIADNIIALIIQNPSLDTSGNLVSADYRYSSRQGIPPPALSGTTLDAALQSEQMPPAIQVTMVTIDEPSAIRMDNGTGTPPTVIENALQGKFVAAAQYATDLSALESALIAGHIRYQILTTSVTLRESKWSSGQ